MIRLLSAALAATCITIALPALSFSDSATFLPSQDNTLYETLDGSLSNGAGVYFFAGQTATGSKRRGVIHFNVAGVIPAGSVVTQVTLRLFMSRTQPSVGPPATVTLHRATSAWGEGASDAPSNEGQGSPSSLGDATWLHTRYSLDLWAMPGGDFSPGAAGATVVDGVGFYSWNAPGMIDVVQSWLDDPGSNFGWVLIGEEGANFTAKRFDSRENPTAANRPLLTVSFDTPLPVEESTWGGIKALYEN